MAIPFMKNEAEGTRDVAFWAGFAITVGLAAVSLYGVWAEPGNEPPEPDSWGIILGKLLYSIAVVGAEFLTAVALYRTIVAETWPRRIVGGLVFLGLAWYCVHNVERGIHRIYPAVFDFDAQELRDLATLAGTQATNIDAAASTAISSIPDQLAQARTDLAKLEAELTTITAKAGTETSIMTAQRHLQGLGYYDGNIDGLWEDLTKRAVARRGDEIRSEMEIKRNVIAGLEKGTPVTTTATASEDQNKTKIANEAKARKREAFGNQITTGAWVLEGARSLTFVVYIAGIAGALIMRRRQDIELAKLDKELEGIKSGKAPEPAATESPATQEPAVANDLQTAPEPPPASHPEPVEAVSPPEPPPPPPEPELTDAQRRGRAGGLGNAQKNAAARAKGERLIVVGDWQERDAEQASAKIAAE